MTHYLYRLRNRVRTLRHRIDLWDRRCEWDRIERAMMLSLGIVVIMVLALKAAGAL